MDIFDLLRWVSVAFFLPHLVSKCFIWPNIAAHFELARWPQPDISARVAMLVEIVIVLSLITGWFLQYGLLIGTAFLLVAGASTLRMSGLVWRWDQGGPEYPLFWGIIMGIVTAHEWGLYQAG